MPGPGWPSNVTTLIDQKREIKPGMGEKNVVQGFLAECKYLKV